MYLLGWEEGREWKGRVVESRHRQRLSGAENEKHNKQTENSLMMMMMVIGRGKALVQMEKGRKCVASANETQCLRNEKYFSRESRKLKCKHSTAKTAAAAAADKTLKD